MTEHTEAARLARALHSRARRARNALQGEPIDSAPDASYVPLDMTEHEPMSTAGHSHLHPAHGAPDADINGNHLHEHAHRGENSHSLRDMIHDHAE
jgi:hypothetical protein